MMFNGDLMGFLWDFMRFYEILWDFMGFYGIYPLVNIQKTVENSYSHRNS